MDASLRRRVREQAGHRCEYCRVHQEDDPLFSFHIDHLQPRQHGGGDELGNLALARYHCNRHKGPNLTAIDPDSGKTTRLFNPRRDSWNAAFQVNGAAIIGRTPIGPATVRLLQMNRAGRLDLRAELAPKQRWP
jgi:5-methylcytosine-specific restriction endonuclease McrA